MILSPFGVVADTKGYQATNTMSGTRLNTKLGDPLSDYRRHEEQMADFAMLDINDIFHTASTEGTGTYNALVEDTTAGGVTDTNANDPLTPTASAASATRTCRIISRRNAR